MILKRIMIMGSAGSGKSTLAKELSRRMGIDAIHLDREFWNPGWIMTEKPEQVRIHESFMERDSWVIDGNYCASLEPRATAADLIIFLDMPFHLCMYRVFSRYFKNRGKIREDMCEGCEEKIDMEFLRYIFFYHFKKKYTDLDKLYNLADKSKIVMLKGPSEVSAFLSEFVI